MINEEDMRYGELPSGISQGQTLVVDGIFMDQHDTVMHPINFNPEASQPEPGLVRVSGTISRLLLPEQRSYNPLYQDLLITDMIQDWNTSEPAATSNPKPYVTTEWIDSWSGVTYIATRSEERRVGEEGSCRWARYHETEHAAHEAIRR